MYHFDFVPFSPVRLHKKFKLASGLPRETGPALMSVTVPQPFKFETEGRASISRIPQAPLRPVYKARLVPRTTYVPDLPPREAEASCSHSDPSRIPFAALPLNASEQDSRNSKRLKRYWNEEKTEAQVFKAREMPSFANPFKPKTSCQSTQPKTFKLASGIRADKRAQFDLELKLRQEARLQELQRTERLAEEQAQLELRMYRESLEFTARTLPSSRPFLTQPSSRLLTFPSSPDLATAKRSRHKEGAEAMDLE
jgi:hypothetical protein